MPRNARHTLQAPLLLAEEPSGRALTAAAPSPTILRDPRASAVRVAAFDLSLTRTGYAVPQLGTLAPPKGRDRGMERLAWIRDRVLELAAGAGAVVLEGYSFGSKGRALFSLAELGGVVRLALHEAALPVVEVAPSALKKYATGRGNAGKEEVLAVAIRRLGYAGHDNNEADALWLRAMAVDYYAGSAFVPAKNREALAAVAWPALWVSE